jgi:hypothetical protein
LEHITAPSADIGWRGGEGRLRVELSILVVLHLGTAAARQEGGRMQIDRPSKERRKHDCVAETAHRKQLGNALNDRDQKGVKRIHSCHLPSLLATCPRDL